MNQLLNFQIDVLPLKDPPSDVCVFCGITKEVDIVTYDNVSFFALCASCQQTITLTL